ncbi:MBOAT family protein [Hymenobacter busanensis]|uniref:MBOAT family protein n=1 Tax=Hymenobacter busanensis TaxID=2607656 RepID=A0A7L4ZUJ3_9BACT|nr:MBOAT family O-acyltransferase [Hymenobacter busanensis]KAA9339402.1 MBOAT family protein [Hymenobacter busanensis]QHJ06838.1 MBOAT family protein [Hymenobacter busanensis]
MLFNSFEFLLFFPVVTLLYFGLPHRLRWALLLLASCWFYMFFRPVYILILFFTIVVDYLAGLGIEQATTPQRRKLLLILSLVANVGVLAVFKYFNFLNDNLTALTNTLGYHNPVPYLSILLPIGLSFHTFQAMSYTIEVYRGHQRAERHLGLYALYVMFYPQLVAGPIERPQNVLHQFRERHTFDYARVAGGLKLMAWGLFKKVVVADRLALLVNQVYNQPTDYQGLPLVLATVLFAFQIYGDFSGYSDMALGSAQVMGFRLMRNFERPYAAASIREFWSRWHISLSTWFRDYLYIPLGGSRHGRGRWYRNVLVVFLVSGLWHGASWTFIIWGALHGFYQVFGLATTALRHRLATATGLARVPALRRALGVGVTFGLVSLAWVFFRANSVTDAIYIVEHLFSGWGQSIAALLHPATGHRAHWLYLDQPPAQLWLALGCLGVMLAVEAAQGFGRLGALVQARPVPVRWSLYVGLLLAIVLLGVFNSSQFIYFQF